jgi:hypothetical protein
VPSMLAVAMRAAVGGEAGVLEAGGVAAQEVGVVAEAASAGAAVGGGGEEAEAVGAEAGGDDAAAVAVEDQRRAGMIELPDPRGAAGRGADEQVAVGPRRTPPSSSAWPGRATRVLLPSRSQTRALCRPWRR